jgi:hypothetical protein
MERPASPPLEQGKAVGTSLGTFLEENQRLITVLGVFSALAIFTSNLHPVGFGQFVSSLLLFLTLLIWFELWGRFPSKGGGWRLDWFEDILFMAILMLVAYWVGVVHVWFHDLLAALVFISTMGGLSRLIKRHDLFNRVFRTVPGGRKSLRYTLGVLLPVTVLAISIFLADKVGRPLDKFVDRLLTETVPQAEMRR